jgi:hypothetical protein
MLNWLRKKINNWLNHYDAEETLAVCEEHELYASGISFKIFSATGGLVVKVHSDENGLRLGETSTLHIIPKDQDLGTSIAKIITLEILRGK